jgi:hypothetical protein
VRKLRWSDSEPDDPSTPIDWRVAALILATLFLNFPFWMRCNLRLWGPGPIPLNAGFILAGTLLMTALFFVGPALATQAARRPLLRVAEDSLGSIPTFGLRLCCMWFLVCWMAAVIALPASWLLQFMLRRDVSLTESGLVAGGVLALAFVTGLQTPTVRAKLALFTNKLGIAILVAALIRARDGWPAISQGFQGWSYAGSLISHEWYGLADLCFYVAPLAFLAADFGYRSRGRRHVATIASLGLILPLFGSLFVVGVIDIATKASPLYRPSLEPNVAMALWSDVASSALPGYMILTSITVFGALRFGAKALSDSAVPVAAGRRVRWAMLAAFILAIAWVSIQDWQRVSVPLEWSATCLVVASAVLTADFVTRGWRVEQARRIDWVGTSALLAGLTAALYLPKWIVGADTDQWWHPRLLPSYGVGFAVCLMGRTVQRLRPGGQAGPKWVPRPVLQ